MRVAARIGASLGLLLILAVLAAAYQISVIHRMEALNKGLSAVDLRAAGIVLRLRSDADDIEESTRKYPLDRGLYGDAVGKRSGDFEKDLSALQQMVSNDSAERREAERLAYEWTEYRRAWNREVAGHSEDPGDSLFGALLENQFTRLDNQIQTVSNTIEMSIGNHVKQVDTIGAEAEQVSWIAGAIALLLAIVVSVALFRSISHPLSQLTRGTRMIAQGQFWHRLPAGRHGSAGTDRTDDEFSEVAKDFNAMSERLGELDAMKKDFVSHVSHELKAPLASIRQTLHLLLEQIPGMLNEQQQRLIRLSSNSAERLAAMVGNLLDVARLEAGTMEYSTARTDLLALARTVAEEFEVQANERQIVLRVEAGASPGTPPGFPVECDRDRMIQVIGNLLDNALKFSPRGGHVIARVHAEQKEGTPFIVFSVADSGPGVPSAHKDRIFGKFHQVRDGKKMTGQGVGLGLAICRSIVEAHNGKIWVEDNPGGGSIFCVELQAAAGMEVRT